MTPQEMAARSNAVQRKKLGAKGYRDEMKKRSKMGVLARKKLSTTSKKKPINTGLEPSVW